MSTIHKLGCLFDFFNCRYQCLFLQKEEELLFIDQFMVLLYGCEKYMIKQSKKEHPAASNVYFSVSVNTSVF